MTFLLHYIWRHGRLGSDLGRAPPTRALERSRLAKLEQFSASQIDSSYVRLHDDYTRLADVFNHIVHTRYLLSRRHVSSQTFEFHLFPSIHRKNQPKDNKWRVPVAEVCFLLLSCFLAHGELGPRAIVHILHRSTSSMMIPFLICFIFIDRPSLTKTRIICAAS